jgi:hypothetical protein
MMLKIFLIIIIVYIIIQQLLDCNKEEEVQKDTQIQKEIVPVIDNKINPANFSSTNYEQILNTSSNDYSQKQSCIPSFANVLDKEQKIRTNIQDEQKVQNFDIPNPWSKIVYNSNNEYPYNFYIKLSIPSLNDYQTWKQIIPNLDFNPQSGELIIPSKDEPSALALANLIVINITGQLSLENILNKNLIQISIAKSRKYELVQNKLREQINENLNKKVKINIPDSFEKDLANDIIDKSDNNFNDTFKHFSDQSNEIDAYDGNDFSYL